MDGKPLSEAMNVLHSPLGQLDIRYDPALQLSIKRKYPDDPTREHLILSDFIDTIETARRKIPLFMEDDLIEWFRHCSSSSRAIALSGWSDYDLSEAIRSSKSFVSVLRLLVTALARGYMPDTLLTKAFMRNGMILPKPNGDGRPITWDEPILKLVEAIIRDRTADRSVCIQFTF